MYVAMIVAIDLDRILQSKQSKISGRMIEDLGLNIRVDAGSSRSHIVKVGDTVGQKKRENGRW